MPLAPAELVDLHLPLPGKEWNIRVAIHRDQVRSVGTHKLKLIGGTGVLHVAIDRYPSVVDGEECYVRVFDAEKEEERWWFLAESAALELVAGDPLVTWGADGRSFTVNLADRPSQRVDLGENGEVIAGPVADGARPG